MELSRSRATPDNSRLKELVSSYRPSIGLAGGLALWWGVNVDLLVIKANQNLIRVECTDPALRKTWIFFFPLCGPEE